MGKVCVGLGPGAPGGCDGTGGAGCGAGGCVVHMLVVLVLELVLVL